MRVGFGGVVAAVLPLCPVGTPFTDKSVGKRKGRLPTLRLSIKTTQPFRGSGGFFMRGGLVGWLPSSIGAVNGVSVAMVCPTGWAKPPAFMHCGYTLRYN